MKNELIVIGFNSAYSCYLNISEKEARERYKKENDWIDGKIEDEGYTVRKINFKDEFEVYDIWEVEDE